VTNTLRTVLAAGVLLCGAAHGGAQDIAGSKDHPLISRYPGSHIDRYASKEFDEHVFPLGKIEGDKFTKSVRLEGKITRIHYQCAKGRSTLEIYRNFESALKQAGFQTLFSCAARDCGSGAVKQTVDGEDYNMWNASDWAVQRHLSAKLPRPEGDAYVSLHLISNTGGEPSAQLDIIEVKPMEGGLVTVDASSLAGDITRTGHASVYGIYFDTGKADVKPESDAALKEVAKLLQQDGGLKLYVVGHTDNQGALDMNMDLSMRRANAVVQALTSKYGAAAARLKALGDGPSAPVASNDSEEGRAKNRRVELVKQ